MFNSTVFEKLSWGCAVIFLLLCFTSSTRAQGENEAPVPTAVPASDFPKCLPEYTWELVQNDTWREFYLEPIGLARSILDVLGRAKERLSALYKKVLNREYLADVYEKRGDTAGADKTRADAAQRDFAGVRGIQLSAKSALRKLRVEVKAWETDVYPVIRADTCQEVARNLDAAVVGLTAAVTAFDRSGIAVVEARVVVSRAQHKLRVMHDWYTRVFDIAKEGDRQRKLAELKQT